MLEELFVINIARGSPVPPRNSLGDGKDWNFTGATLSPAKRLDKAPTKKCGSLTSVSLHLADYCAAGTSLLHSPDRRHISGGCPEEHSHSAPAHDGLTGTPSDTHSSCILRPDRPRLTDTPSHTLSSCT